MESSFSEMRCKQVINVADGSLLGHIVDLVFDIRTSRILGFVVPGYKVGFSFFKSPPEIFIPYCNICKIGEDVVLVEVHNLPSRHKRVKMLGDAKVMSSSAGQYQNPQDYQSVTAANKQSAPQAVGQNAGANQNATQNMSDINANVNRNYYINQYDNSDGKDDNFLNR